MSQVSEQGRVRGADRPRPFKPRSTSCVTVALLVLGVASIAAFAFSEFARGYMAAWHLMPFEGPESALRARRLLWAGIALALASAPCEALSRLRVPPPTWRVRQELSKALIDMGLLPRDMRRWKGVYWVAPVAAYSLKERRLSLLFSIKHASATEERFSRIEDAAMSSFSHSQGVSIEPAIMGGRRVCWRLSVWYGSDRFGGAAQRINPW